MDTILLWETALVNTLVVLFVLLSSLLSLIIFGEVDCEEWESLLLLGDEEVATPMGDEEDTTPMGDEEDATPIIGSILMLADIECVQEYTVRWL